MDFEDRKWKSFLQSTYENSEAAVSVARIGPLDPDFLFILYFAMASDFVFFVLAILDWLFGISWLIGIFLSIPVLLVIGFWHYSRNKTLSRVKEEANAKIRKAHEMYQKQRQAKEMAKQAQKGAAKQTGKEAAAKSGKAMAAKSSRKVVYKTTGKVVAKKGGVALAGTNFPIIGLIPFYTIWVLSTLKEK